MRFRAVIFAMMLVIATKSSAEEVQFPSGKFAAADEVIQLTAQLQKPDGAGPFPAIVLLHTCSGLSAHVTRDWPQYLVGLGYVVLTIDTFGSRRHFSGCPSLRGRFALQARDAYGALDYLAGQSFVDPHRIAAMGMSMGAIAINEFIRNRAARQTGAEFQSFVSLYGRCRDMKPDTARKAPHLMIMPEKDNYTQECQARSKAIPMTFHILPGAYHAFDEPEKTSMRSDPFGNPMLYDADATEKARSLVREFFEKQFKR